MHYDFGIGFLPGILFSDCSLLYARLGYSNGKFKVDTTDTSLQNISKSLNGFRYGLGFRQRLSECLSFRLEYGQINYKKLKMFTFDPVGNVAKATHIKPKLQRFEVGLLFTF
jgi:outer membrane immunogenic protein